MVSQLLPSFATKFRNSEKRNFPIWNYMSGESMWVYVFYMSNILLTHNLHSSWINTSWNSIIVPRNSIWTSSDFIVGVLEFKWTTFDLFCDSAKFSIEKYNILIHSLCMRILSYGRLSNYIRDYQKWNVLEINRKSKSSCDIHGQFGLVVIAPSGITTVTVLMPSLSKCCHSKHHWLHR